MTRVVLRLAVGAALYGYSIGSVHGVRIASWNLLKFPALLLVTGAVCALAFVVTAWFVTRALRVRDVAALTLRAYADLATLLAALAPVSLFLAWTVEQPTEMSLGEYPLFLGLNVAFIAVCGVVALRRQGLALMGRHALGRGRSMAILLAWLAVSLFTGGQCAWYLRPWFGPSTSKNLPVVMGTMPDYRGAQSFYEAVWHLVDPPALPEGYFREGED